MFYLFRDKTKYELTKSNLEDFIAESKHYENVLKVSIRKREREQISGIVVDNIVKDGKIFITVRGTDYYNGKDGIFVVGIIRKDLMFTKFKNSFWIKTKKHEIYFWLEKRGINGIYY